jgi:hypothetical protein
MNFQFVFGQSSGQKRSRTHRSGGHRTYLIYVCAMKYAECCRWQIDAHDDQTRSKQHIIETVKTNSWVHRSAKARDGLIIRNVHVLYQPVFSCSNTSAICRMYHELEAC